jgi:transcriptional regulator GlxA family with amidase domain
MTVPQTIGIYLYKDAEVLDFAGPFEVFNTAARVSKRIHPESSEVRFMVVTIAENPGIVSARAGLLVMPDCVISQHPPLDVLIVPGGIHMAEMEKPQVLRWVRRVNSETQITAAVCTGAFILGKAGILNDLNVTTHWEDIPDLQALLPGCNVLENARWVDEGHIVTSAGISAGIDMALHLVSRLEDEALAVMTARQMEYDWQKR